MEQKVFRKLNVDLPREPIVDDRPWMVAGWLFALIVLAIILYAYLHAGKVLRVGGITKETTEKVGKNSVTFLR